MITTRCSTPGPRTLKYQYKTNVTAPRPLFGPQDLTSKKESRVKSKIDQKSNLNSSYTSSLLRESKQTPYEPNSENIAKCLDLAEYHKKESQILKKKNDSLDLKLKQQTQEITQLKSQLQQLQQSITLSQNKPHPLPHDPTHTYASLTQKV